MGSISDKISYLEQTKRKIADAIVEKGQTVVYDSDTFRSYADKIKEISTKGDTEPITIIPEAEDVVITADGTTVDGYNPITVLGDKNLKPENIKNGVEIFGVAGILNPSGSDPSPSPTSSIIGEPSIGAITFRTPWVVCPISCSFSNIVTIDNTTT